LMDSIKAMQKLIISLFLIFINFITFGQNDSLSNITLEPVSIKTSRIETKELKLPKAVTVIDAAQTRSLRQNLSLQEYLQQVPGLYITGANNFSQDLRISIRGFGARAAFGIRGVKIIVDGIPETTPDGQGQIDNLNLEVVEQIEVLRGPASSLYGNASGGTININTIDSPKKPLSLSSTLGSYGFQKHSISSGFKNDNNSFIVNGNYIKTNGYRIQSGFENYNVNTKYKHRFSKKTKISLQANYTYNPLAEDAGGLTLEEINEDREQARDRNITFKTGENLKQFKIGTSFDYKISEVLDFSTYAFYANRDFGNKLPFESGGIVALNRNYFGNGANITMENNFNKIENKLQFGYDLAAQYEQRKRFDNLIGEQGELVFDQLESFSSFGIYAIDNLEFGDFLIQTGIRFDTNVLKAEDDFLSDGDDSDKIVLNAFSPSFGATYSINKISAIFSNFSTSFETPALSELSSNPNGNGGFNENLDAQKAFNIDLGYRYKNDATFVEAVAFYIETEDDLVPFELADFPDRTFYRNAGSTLRKGFELSLTQILVENLQFRGAYTLSDFTYTNYRLPSGNFEGNELPGLPKHKVYSSLLFTHKGLKILAEGNYVSSLFADDANETEVPSYIVANLNFGYKLKFSKLETELSFGINNLFNTYYFDNIRSNAFGKRYYEPAATRNYFGGIKVSI